MFHSAKKSPGALAHRGDFSDLGWLIPKESRFLPKARFLIRAKRESRFFRRKVLIFLIDKPATGHHKKHRDSKDGS